MKWSNPASPHTRAPGPWVAIFLNLIYPKVETKALLFTPTGGKHKYTPAVSSSGFTHLLHFKTLLPASTVCTSRCINIHQGSNLEKMGWTQRVFCKSESQNGVSLHGSATPFKRITVWFRISLWWRDLRFFLQTLLFPSFTPGWSNSHLFSVATQTTSGNVWVTTAPGSDYANLSLLIHHGRYVGSSDTAPQIRLVSWPSGWPHEKPISVCCSQEWGQRSGRPDQPWLTGRCLGAGRTRHNRRKNKQNTAHLPHICVDWSWGKVGC